MVWLSELLKGCGRKYCIDRDRSLGTRAQYYKNVLVRFPKEFFWNFFQRQKAAENFKSVSGESFGYPARQIGWMIQKKFYSTDPWNGTLHGLNE